VRDALKSVRGKQVLAFQRDLARLNIWFGSTKAKTLTDLAAKTGITADKLTKQVARYNEYAQGKTADPLGKTQSDLADLSAGPYYAINVSLYAKLFPCPTLTLGGLAVDDETGLVQGDGGDIKGLYAAGRNAVGICAHNYVSGLSIADGIFSGRRAAKHISRHKGA
jgi:3-oxo-5alpha-steroid 4-dehydrogenase